MTLPWLVQPYPRRFVFAFVKSACAAPDYGIIWLYVGLLYGLGAEEAPLAPALGARRGFRAKALRVWR